MCCLFLEDKCSFHTERQLSVFLNMFGHCGLWWEIIKQINIKPCWAVELPHCCSSLVIQLFQGKLSFLDTFKCTKGIIGQQKANRGVHSLKDQSFNSCFTLPLQKSAEITACRSQQAELGPGCRWCAMSEGNVKAAVSQEHETVPQYYCMHYKENPLNALQHWQGRSALQAHLGRARRYQLFPTGSSIWQVKSSLN